MIALAALVHLPRPSITAFGVVADRGSQPVRRRAVDDARSGDNPARAGVRHQRPRIVVFVAYPLIPWIGVTAVGYGLGRIYDWRCRAPAGVLSCAWAGC